MQDAQQKAIIPSIYPRLEEGSSISLIGMAGAGKTTVGRALAHALGWAHIDTDYLIEANYGATLQMVADSMTKEAFLDVEGATLMRVRSRRTVLSTGGSVVYRDATMKHLASLGPIIYIDVPLSLILERIARNPDRGLAIAPGQTIEDLFNERKALYSHYADFTVRAEKMPPAQCAATMVQWLKEKPHG